MGRRARTNAISRKRERTLGRCAAALLLVLLSGISGVQAGEEDRLKWAIAEGDALRYDIEEEDAARVSPDANFAPIIPRTMMVSLGDFAEGRHPKIRVGELGDVPWFFALELPAGEFKKTGEAPLAEKFDLNGVGVVTVKGKETVTRKGGSVLLKTTLDLALEGAAPPSIAAPLETGTLTVDRTFDEKKRFVKDGRFVFEVRRKIGGKILVYHDEGRIVCAGKLDLAGKGFLKDVQLSINRSSKWLQEQLAKRLGSYKAAKANGPDALGYVALPTFALLRSGVPPAQLKDAFDFMSKQELKHTYSVALYIMALEAKSVRRDEVLPQAGGRTVARFSKGPTPPADKAEMARCIRWLVNTRLRGWSTWNYFGNPGKGDEGEGGGPIDDTGRLTERCDHSISQFAILALHCGDTSGIPIPEAVWKDAVKELTGSQMPDGADQSLKDVEWTAAAPQGIPPEGVADPFSPTATRSRNDSTRSRVMAHARGWSYNVRAIGGNPCGSMSAAGLSSIVVSREALRRAGKLDDKLELDTCRSARDGVAWFCQNWSPTTNVPNGKAWYFYYLYSVEKAMEITGVERMGTHEWWREGAIELLSLEKQKTGGFSLGAEANMEDTAFALLFLNRATLPARIVTEDTLRIASGGKDDEPDAWDKVFVEGTGHVRLRQVLYALDTATADVIATRLKLAEKGFDVLEEDRRPRLIPDLLKLAGNSDRKVRVFVQRALRATTGSEDEGKARAFFARWEDIVRACEEDDYASSPKLRAIVKEADATAPFPLKRAACLALAKLRAVEAAPDIIVLLEDKDPLVRRFGATALVQLVGPKVEYDPQAADSDRARGVQAWRDWWKKDGPRAVFDEEIRRDVAALDPPGEAANAAEARLKTKGKRAVRGLIDGLRDEKTRDRARALLEQATGERLGNDPAGWLAWLEKQGDKD